MLLYVIGCRCLLLCLIHVCCSCSIVVFLRRCSYLLMFVVCVAGYGGACVAVACCWCLLLFAVVCSWYLCMIYCGCLSMVVDVVLVFCGLLSILSRLFVVDCCVLLGAICCW